MPIGRGGGSNIQCYEAGCHHPATAGYVTATTRTAYSSNDSCATTDGQYATTIYVAATNAVATVPVTAATTDAVAGNYGLSC